MMNGQLDGWVHEWMKGPTDGWCEGIAELSYGWNSYYNAQVDTDEMNRSVNG